MHTRSRYWFLNVLLVVAAYGYLVYKLVTFDDYAGMAASFRAAGWLEYACLLLAIALMPVNVLCESWKWRVLLRSVVPISLTEAERQVYFGFVGAFVTPYRAGDYPSRVLLMRDRSVWMTAIALGLVGTLAMLVVEICLGIPSLILFAQYESAMPLHTMLVVLGVVVVLLLLLPVGLRCMMHIGWKNEQLCKMFAALRQLTYGQFMYVVGVSLVRFIVWALQLALVLYFCGVVLSPMQLLLSIPTYYLLVGVLPSLPVADMAIRGSISILVFGAFSQNIAGIAIAVVIIWIVNTILPMLVGSVVHKTYQPVVNIN